MTVPYFELLNPQGFKVENIGRIHSPRLRDICDKGYKEYQYALTMLLMTPRDFFEGVAKATNEKSPYDELTVEQQNELDIFSMLTASESTRADLISALGFFICGKLEFFEPKNCILVNPATDENGALAVDGIINATNWPVLCDVCLQAAHIESEKKKVRKYKSERDRKRFEEFDRKKAEYEKNLHKGSKSNPDYELANIISSVATFHNSLNMVNIWDMTVYQVHDTFDRQRIKEQVEISDLNYSVWGGDSHESNLWFKSLKSL